MCLPNSFKTKVDFDVFLECYSDNGMSLQTREVLLEWSLELEVRKFGIKSFIVTVPEQTFEIEFTKYNERLDEDSRIEETIIVKNVIVDINATKLQHGISPKSLTFYNDKWTLEF